MTIMFSLCKACYSFFFFLRERKEELIWVREEAEGKDWEEWREGKPWLRCNA